MNAHELEKEPSKGLEEADSAASTEKLDEEADSEASTESFDVPPISAFLPSGAVLTFLT